MGSGKDFIIRQWEQQYKYEDNYYPFRQDSTFLYYTGINISGLNAVIDVDNDETILFGDDVSIDHVIWMGAQTKLADIAEMSGIKKVESKSSIFDYVNKDTLYLPPLSFCSYDKIRRVSWNR